MNLSLDSIYYFFFSKFCSKFCYFLRILPHFQKICFSLTTQKQFVDFMSNDNWTEWRSVINLIWNYKRDFKRNAQISKTQCVIWKECAAQCAVQIWFEITSMVFRRKLHETNFNYRIACLQSVVYVFKREIQGSEYLVAILYGVFF